MSTAEGRKRNESRELRKVIDNRQRKKTKNKEKQTEINKESENAEK
jgi:hypothetical protein